jgi:hypothetical protein
MQVGYYDILIKIILRKKGRTTFCRTPILFISVCHLLLERVDNHTGT